MNRSATLLGGSTSIALIILASNPAHAMIPRDLTSTDSGMGIQTLSQPMSQPEAPLPPQVIEARIKQLALAKFGCTCANCMNTVRQMVQQGQLSL